MTSIIKVDTIQDSSGGSAINMGAGSVVQTQTTYLHANTSSHISIASTTAVQIGDGTSYTNLQVSITPRFSNSKVLITCYSNMIYIPNNVSMDWELYRDSTALVVRSGDYAVPNYYGWVYNFQNSGGSFYGSSLGQHIDTPNTTSAVTYKPYHRLDQGSGTAYSCHSGGHMIMTATEIKV